MAANPGPYLIDTGGPDDNVPLDDLAADADARFRPSRKLIAAVGGGGHGRLDRPIVPLLNALQARGIRTLESCAGGMLFVESVDRRTVDAVKVVRRPWMQVRWAAGVEIEDGVTGDVARTELWWSRRVPNWGGYMAVQADWRWRATTRTRRHVDATLLTAAQQIRDCPLPRSGRPSAEGAWVRDIARILLADPATLGEAEWFEVVLCRDSQGWSVTARREYTPVGSLCARSLVHIRRRVDRAPDRLLSGEGTAGLAELRAALASRTQRRPWSKLDSAERQAMLDTYAISPADHARAGIVQTECRTSPSRDSPRTSTGAGTATAAASSRRRCR